MYVRKRDCRKKVHTVVALSNSEGQTAGGTRERQIIRGERVKKKEKRRLRRHTTAPYTHPFSRPRQTGVYTKTNIKNALRSTRPEIPPHCFFVLLIIMTFLGARYVSFSLFVVLQPFLARTLQKHMPNYNSK